MLDLAEFFRADCKDLNSDSLSITKWKDHDRLVVLIKFYVYNEQLIVVF